MIPYNSLPFEIKSHILAQYIEVSIPGADVSCNYMFDSSWSDQLTRSILHFLQVFPELGHEVTRIIDHMIARLEYLETMFSKRLEDFTAVWGPPEDWHWGFRKIRPCLSRTKQRLEENVTSKRWEKDLTETLRTNWLSENRWMHGLGR